MDRVRNDGSKLFFSNYLSVYPKYTRNPLPVDCVERGPGRRIVKARVHI
jgi:hypothetical protein